MEGGEKDVWIYGNKKNHLKRCSAISEYDRCDKRLEENAYRECGLADGFH